MLDRDRLISEASIRLIEELTQADSIDEFNLIIHRLGYDSLLLDYDYWTDTMPFGKILVIGDLSIKYSDLEGCLKSLGINKKRLEHISFDDINNYDITRLEYSDIYRLILLGPVPHSAKGMGDQTSVIISLENNPNITKVKRLISGNKLKITKQSVKQCLLEEIESGYLMKG